MGFIFQENEKSREEVMERIQKDLGDRLQMSREELGAIKNQMKGENTKLGEVRTYSYECPHMGRLKARIMHSETKPMVMNAYASPSLPSSSLSLSPAVLFLFQSVSNF